MIDIYNEIYTQLYTRLHVDFPDIYMANEYLFTTAQFPCVTVEETDNYTLADTQTNRLYENHGVLVYDINVYSNLKSGRKSECRKIIRCVDDEMQTMGFTRIFLNPIPNEQDATIYRMTARYRAVVSDDKTIYRY